MAEGKPNGEARVNGSPSTYGSLQDSLPASGAATDPTKAANGNEEM